MFFHIQETAYGTCLSSDRLRSTSVRVAADGAISFFFMAESYSIVHTPHLLYPFSSWWPLGSPAHLGRCRRCCPPWPLQTVLPVLQKMPCERGEKLKVALASCRAGRTEMATNHWFTSWVGRGVCNQNLEPWQLKFSHTSCLSLQPLPASVLGWRCSPSRSSRLLPRPLVKIGRAHV